MAEPFRRLARRLLIVVYVVALFATVAFYGWTIHVKSQQTWSSDFMIFYVDAKYFLAGKDMYAPIPFGILGPTPTGFAPHDPFMHPNLNLPFQVIFFLPLTLFDFTTAFWIWSMLSILLGAGAVLLLVRAHCPERQRWRYALLLCTLLFLYFPTWANIVLGQFGLVLLFLLTVAWLAIRQNSEPLTGIVLGLCLALKPFTGLFLLLFLLLRRWRLVAWYLACFAALTLLALLFIGIGPHLTYLGILRKVTWYASSWNASLIGVLTRLFGGSENIPLIEIPRLAFILGYLAIPAGIAGLYWSLSAIRDQPLLQMKLGFAAMPAMMLLLSPLGWIYYFPCLLLSLVIMFETALQLGRTTQIGLLAAVAWLLSTIPHFLIPSEEMSDPVLIFTYPMAYFLSLALFLGALAALTRWAGTVPPPVAGNDGAGLPERFFAFMVGKKA